MYNIIPDLRQSATELIQYNVAGTCDAALVHSTGQRLYFSLIGAALEPIEVKPLVDIVGQQYPTLPPEKVQTRAQRVALDLMRFSKLDERERKTLADIALKAAAALESP